MQRKIDEVKKIDQDIYFECCASIKITPPFSVYLFCFVFCFFLLLWTTPKLFSILSLFQNVLLILSSIINTSINLCEL